MKGSAVSYNVAELLLGSGSLCAEGLPADRGARSRGECAAGHRATGCHNGADESAGRPMRMHLLRPKETEDGTG